MRSKSRLKSVIAAAMTGAVLLVACGGGGGGRPGGEDPDGGGGSGGGHGGGNPPPDVGPSLSSVNVFYSGHSLLDEPFAIDAQAVASSLGKANQWNQQIIIGSPLRMRTRGDSYTDPAFPGYASGANRDGAQNLDVRQELRSPSTISGAYDALVLAERHDLGLTLQYEDTVRYARHFHDRLIEGNPQGTTYLYHAWLGVRDKTVPADWVAYERSAAVGWRCVASRINRSLEAEGRGDRVRYMPAGLALAELIDLAVQGQVEGLAGTPAEVVDQLMVDDVHETPLGAYFVSLVNVATLYRASPEGAWAPDGVSESQKRSLQALAWRVAAESIAAGDPDLSTCQAHMTDSYCAAFHTYRGSTNEIANCRALFADGTSNNPFRYEAATDATYWFPAPLN
jgi:hypothetical protein